MVCEAREYESTKPPNGSTQRTPAWVCKLSKVEGGGGVCSAVKHCSSSLNGRYGSLPPVQERRPEI